MIVGLLERIIPAFSTSLWQLVFCIISVEEGVVEEEEAEEEEAEVEEEEKRNMRGRM